MPDAATPVPDTAVIEARRDLAAAFRWAARMNLSEGICNHFSLMVPGSRDRYLINPQGIHWAEMRAGDLVVCDAEGRIVEGEGVVEATAHYIHSRIHRAHPAAACVLHTHMPYATALTMVEGGRIEPCLQTNLRFYDDIAYDDTYEGLALSTDEGDRMAAALGSKSALFLANHGVIVVGRNVGEAFDTLYYLERAAQAQVIALSTGRKLRMVGDNLARSTQQQIASDLPVYGTLHFKSLRRMLDRREPDYAD